MVTDISEALEPAGRGVGPVLEVRDVFQVLERDKDRPLGLEKKALRLSAKLLDLCFADMKQSEYKPGDGERVAIELLESGKALAKMREIIKAQGGDPDFSHQQLKLPPYRSEHTAISQGQITVLNNRSVSVIARILGSPTDRKAGIFLNRKLEERIDKGDILCTLYSSDKWRLAEAVETLKHLPIYQLE